MNRSRPTRFLLAVPVLALVLVACGGQGAARPVDTAAPAAGRQATVTVDTFDFRPDPLVVAAGTTITFVNEDAIDHTVTAGTREAPHRRSSTASSRRRVRPSS